MGGGPRQSSAPVCIPGASEGAHRSRIHSSGDLAAMQRRNASPRVRHPLKEEPYPFEIGLDDIGRWRNALSSSLCSGTPTLPKQAALSPAPPQFVFPRRPFLINSANVSQPLHHYCFCRSSRTAAHVWMLIGSVRMNIIDKLACCYVQPLKTVRWTSGLTKAPSSAPAASAAVSLEQPPHLQEVDLQPISARTTGFNIPHQPDRGHPGSRSATQCSHMLSVSGSEQHIVQLM